MNASVLIVLTLVSLALLLVAIVTLYDASARKQEIAKAVLGDDRDSVLSQARRAANQRARATKWGRKLAMRLGGATINLGPADFVGIVAVIAVSAGLISRGLLGWVGAAVLMVGVAVAADRWLDRQQRKRADRFIAQLPELARVLGNSASAGLALRSSVDIVAREMEAPASEEFVEVSRRLALGTPLEDALGDLALRLPSAELSVLVKTIVVQNRAGGALVTALTSIAETLDDRRQLNREVKTVMAGAVFTGYLVIAIAVGAVVLVNAVSPGALDALVQTLPGQAVLVVAVALFLLGHVLIRRLTRVGA